LIYYRRTGTESAGMKDFEIRDVMNRRKHPQFEVEVRWCNVSSASNPNGHVFDVRVRNSGPVMAKQFRVEVVVPVLIDGRPCLPVRNAWEHTRLENNVMVCRAVAIVGSGDEPIFPNDKREASVEFERRDLPIEARLPIAGSHDFGSADEEVSVIVYADSMPRLLVKGPLMQCWNKWRVFGEA
jgi:hypothetical protein